MSTIDGRNIVVEDSAEGWAFINLMGLLSDESITLLVEILGSKGWEATIEPRNVAFPGGAIFCPKEAAEYVAAFCKVCR